MGNTFKTGNYVNGIFQDTSNNIGIGAAPSGTYKFEITGTSKVSGVLTLGATLSNGTYTYTLPAATGTLALTSDIPVVTGFVPYTGATADVNLGIYTLTASGVDSVGYTARGSGTLSGYLIIKQGTTYLGNVVGYNSINANARKYVFISDVDGTNYKSAIFELSSLTNNTDRTYTLPDASGTIALVGGSGVGTVTSVAALTIGTSGTDLSSTVANSTTTPVITLNVPTASATNRGALSSADWTTFNNKQGTITLTTTGTSGAATFSANTLNIPNYGSALSGYLPLTGGTLTGQTLVSYAMSTDNGFIIQHSNLTQGISIGYNTIKTSGTSANQNLTFYSQGTGVINLVSNTQVNGTFTALSTGSFTGALSGTSATFSGDITSSNGKFYVVNTYGYYFGSSSNLTGFTGSNGTQTITVVTNGSTAISIASNQYVTLSAALGGTSASFSTTITSGGNINSGDSVTLLGELYWGGTQSGQKTRAYTTGSSGSATLNYSFWTGSAWFIRATLDSNGAATFISSVTAAELASTSGIYAQRNGSNTQGSGPYFLLANAAANQLWYQQLNASNGLDFWYNGSVKLNIASTGAATFSSRVNINGATDNASYALNIYGDATFSGTRAAPAYIYALRNGDDSKLILKAGSTAGYFSQIDVSGWNGTGTPAYISLNAGSGTGIYINNGNNVLIGTTTDDTVNKLQVTGYTKSSGFKSLQGTVSIASSASATIYTVPSAIASDGVYYVYCRLAGGAAIYMASAIVTALGSTNELFISNTRTGANVALIVTGSNIQITNLGFATFNWQYSIIFQPVD